MASEPRNYPYYVFVAYDEDFSAQTYDIAVSLEPGNLVGKPVKYIRHDLNTIPAPAATDTGLEAVLLPGWPKLCEFSQAEELLAAERAEKEKLEGAWLEAEGIISDLKADNAAKDARIKELDRCHEGTIDLCNQKTAQIEALEAKLATANALVTCCCGDLVDAHNMGSGHSPVDQYHYAMMQLEAKIAAANDLVVRAQVIIPDHYVNWHRDARAALGGEP